MRRHITESDALATLGSFIQKANDTSTEARDEQGRFSVGSAGAAAGAAGLALRARRGIQNRGGLAAATGEAAARTARAAVGGIGRGALNFVAGAARGLLKSEDHHLQVLAEFAKSSENEARDAAGKWVAGTAGTLREYTLARSKVSAPSVKAAVGHFVSLGHSIYSALPLHSAAPLGAPLVNHGRFMDVAAQVARGMLKSRQGPVKREDASLAVLQDFVKHNYDPSQPRDAQSGRWVKLDANENEQKRDLVRHVAARLVTAAAAGAVAGATAGAVRTLVSHPGARAAAAHALALHPGTRALASHLAGQAWSAAKAIGAHAISLTGLHPAAGGGVHATFSAADMHFAFSQGLSVQGHPQNLTGAAKGALQQAHDALLRNGLPSKPKLNGGLPVAPFVEMPE